MLVYAHRETIMSIEQAVLETLRTLPPEKQQELLSWSPRLLYTSGRGGLGARQPKPAVVPSPEK